MRVLLVAAVFALGATYGCARQDELPEANPARPTVSNPATLTPLGYLQFETGYFTGEHSPESSRVSDINESVKLTVERRVELVLQAAPFATGKAATTQTAFGDAFVGLQTIVAGGGERRPTLALSYLRQVRNSGLPDIDLGTPSNSLLVLVSGDVKKFHYDSNAVFNEVANAAARRGQFGQTLSVSHPLTAKFSLSGELWHFTQPFLRGHAVGNLWAAGYTVKPNLVLDGGFDVGLTRTSTRSEVFFGFTYVLPKRLW